MVVNTKHSIFLNMHILPALALAGLAFCFILFGENLSTTFINKFNSSSIIYLNLFSK